jgi:hypothetical protein
VKNIKMHLKNRAQVCGSRWGLVMGSFQSNNELAGTKKG